MAGAAELSDQLATAEFDRIVLQKIQLSASLMIDPELRDPLANAEFKTFAGHCGDVLVGQLRTYVWGMNEKRIAAKWPDGWWQAVKDRFAPAWFLRRWPVRWDGINEPQFEAVYTSLHRDKITSDPARGRKRLDIAQHGHLPPFWDQEQ